MLKLIPHDSSGMFFKFDQKPGTLSYTMKLFKYKKIAIQGFFQGDRIASWDENKSIWQRSLNKQSKSLNRSESLFSVLNFNKDTLFYQLMTE